LRNYARTEASIIAAKMDDKMLVYTEAMLAP
jgi:hypothetical protein